MTAFDTLVSVADFAEAISALFTVAGAVVSVQVAAAGIRYVRDVIEEETAPQYSPDGFCSDDAPYEYTQADWDAQYAELQASEREGVVTVDAERYEAAKAEMAFEVEADAAWARVGSGEMSHDEYRKRYEGASARDGSL